MRIATMLRMPARWPALLAAPLLALGLSALPAGAMADPPDEGMPAHGMSGPGGMHGPDAARMHEAMQQRVQRHLDRLSSRLEIRASQEPAWNGFAAAVRAMLPAGPPQRPAADMDAATRARRMADRLAERARKFEQLADATAKLEQALDAPQKQVLDEVARDFGERMHMRREHWMHGMHGDHEGPMMDGDHWHHGDDDMHGGGMHHGMMQGDDHGAADSFDDRAGADY